MKLSDNDLAAIAQSAQETKLGDVDPTQYVERVIDFLDGIRRKYQHGGWNPGKWMVKQGLDVVIAALHQWVDKQRQQPAAGVGAGPGAGLGSGAPTDTVRR